MSERQFLLALLDEAFATRSWHGTNLRGSLRRVGPEAAAWRPHPRRHNVWEIVVHAAYWKYAVRRRLTGEKRGSFAHRGSNWFLRPTALTDEAWREDVALLVAEHARMREAIARLKPAQLSKEGRLLRGIAAHDLYHAGQIQVLKKLYAGSAV